MGIYSKYTDEQLIELLRQDDEPAFTELYNRYWDKLIIRAITQLQSSHDSEEILHDIFVRLWNRRHTLLLKNSFHTYIAAVLKYEVLKKLAERGKKRISAMDLSMDPTDNSTLQWLDFYDLQERLEQSVKQLPEKCQLVFRLSREKNLSEKEIANTLRIAPKTVENHMNRALKRLRSALGSFFSFFLF